MIENSSAACHARTLIFLKNTTWILDAPLSIYKKQGEI